MDFFPQYVLGVFLRRKNTFIAECMLDDKTVIAHLPNPGRMIELLYYGCKVYLIPNTDGKRTTAYTVAAVEREGKPVILDTQVANRVARYLLQEKRIPGWEDLRILKTEAVFGASRFDFLLENASGSFILEVKSCTLFEGQMAMFPDAVTARGRRHLLELADLAKQGYRCGVLFLVHWPQAEYFLPDYHTDLDFAQTFYQVWEQLDIKAISLKWNEQLQLQGPIRELHIPVAEASAEIKDSGAYIVVLYLPETRLVTVGKLGAREFQPGYYLYVGSAKVGLRKRLARHGRRRKKFHWHIDYLREVAEFAGAFAVRSSLDREHELAVAVEQVAHWQVPGFGCSDCSCRSHLFGMNSNPAHSREFVKLLLDFRMGKLAQDLL